jgi:excisionase family DNA binding protein
MQTSPIKPTLHASNPERPARKLITIGELSLLWSVPKATLYNWVNQGRLPYVKLGRSLRFDLVQIEQLCEQSTIAVAGKR